MDFSFGTNYDLDFIPETGMELVNSNWDVDNWITGNANDGFVYDGCAAFQKVLDGKIIPYNVGKSMPQNVCNIHQ